MAFLTLPAGANPTLDPGGAVLPFPQERIMGAKVVYTINAGGGLTQTVAETWRGLDGWIINGAGIVPGTSAGFVPNSLGDPSILEGQTSNSDYRDVLNFSGNASTAMGALQGPGRASVELTVARSPYASSTSDAWFDWFADSTIDTLPDVASVVNRNLAAMKARGNGALVLASSGTSSLTIVGAAGAFGWRSPIVLAGDIGLGFGQIPNDPLLWNAGTFAAHPRAFVRNAAAVFEARLVDPVDPLVTADAPAVTADPALSPLSAISAPSHSVWRLVIKGNASTVIISHGALDVRRPRDIWNRVLVPAIARGGASPLTIYNYRYDAGVKVFYSIGTLTELEFLDFALCLDLMSSGAAPVLDPLDLV